MSGKQTKLPGEIRQAIGYARIIMAGWLWKLLKGLKG